MCTSTYIILYEYRQAVKNSLDMNQNVKVYAEYTKK